MCGMGTPMTERNKLNWLLNALFFVPLAILIWEISLMGLHVRPASAWFLSRSAGVALALICLSFLWEKSKRGRGKGARASIFDKPTRPLYVRAVTLAWAAVVLLDILFYYAWTFGK